MSFDAEIARCLRREREERAAANAAVAAPSRSAHFTMAERYAERALQLFEARFDAQAEAIVSDIEHVQSKRRMIIRSVW